MENQPLTREIVPNTALIQLNMRMSADSFDVMLYNPLEDRSLIYRHIDLPTQPDERMKAVEDFIYDNPVLTSEFHKTNFLVNTSRFTLLPGDITDENIFTPALKAACPDITDATVTIANRVDQLDAIFLSAPSERLVNFVRRTFLNAPIYHSLVPLARYFCSLRSAGAPQRMMLNVRRNSMDVIVTDGNGLRFANTVSFREIDDAVYYVLALTDYLQDNISEYLLQEYLVDKKEYTVDCYVSQEGEILVSVPRERLEVMGGEVTRTVTTRIPELEKMSRDIIRSFNLFGPVTLQFLYDMRSSRYLLMEINPRLGGGVICSVYAGAPIPDYILREALGAAVEPCEDWANNCLMARYQKETIFYNS